MEVDGKEFLRNVSLEQDKERLIQEQKKLEALKRESVMRERSYTPPNQESAYVNLSTEEENPIEEEQNIIEDLMLEVEDPTKNKKRYILLGIGLILVFIITILVIRLVSNNNTKEKMENLNPKSKELVTDKILDKIDTNEEYQKVIDKKEAQKQIQKQEKTKINEIDIPNEVVPDTPLVIEKPKPVQKPQRDLFGLTKEQKIKKENIVKKQEKTTKVIKQKTKSKVVKKVATQKVKKVKKTVTKKTTNISGYYIQIGAFSKKPAKSLLSSITKKGYNYNVHKMVIKGRIYNKVLIGAYPTRAIASKNLKRVRKDFNNKNAYILKF